VARLRRSLQRIATISRKDLLDAIREAKVLVAILVPLGLGLLYNYTFREEPRLQATVAYVSTETTLLPDALRTAAAPAVQLTFKESRSDDETRDLVRQGKADVGLVAAPGFDAAVQRGESPPLTVVERGGRQVNSSAPLVVSRLEVALVQMAGQRPPAVLQPEILDQRKPTGFAIMERLGIRQYLVLASLLTLVAMVAMFAVPIILAEEKEKKTLDALTLVASFPEVMVAKAVVGIVYTALATTLLLRLTRIAPADPATFVASLGLLSVTLIGFGLLLGSILPSTQLQNWTGFLLIPVIAPAFLVGLPLDPAPALQILVNLFPTSQGSRLAVNGLSGKALFGDAWLSYLVIAVWCALAYGLLWWRLATRED
jgi:ABC-2 type transport system permease protein